MAAAPHNALDRAHAGIILLRCFRIYSLPVLGTALSSPASVAEGCETLTPRRSRNEHGARRFKDRAAARGIYSRDGIDTEPPIELAMAEPIKRGGEENIADVDNVDDDGSRDHQELKLGDAAALHGVAKERKARALGLLAWDIEPVVILASGPLFGNTGPYAIVLEGASRVKAGDFKLYGGNRHVEDEEDVVEEEHPRRK
ncbi:hypothetical protein E4U41_006215 [Claviceps citrina]|nr:hypothetical protein E4U41_006215 [Claviceps citrina]